MQKRAVCFLAQSVKRNLLSLLRHILQYHEKKITSMLLNSSICNAHDLKYIYPFLVENVSRPSLGTSSECSCDQSSSQCVKFTCRNPSGRCTKIVSQNCRQMESSPVTKIHARPVYISIETITLNQVSLIYHWQAF